MYDLDRNIFACLQAPGQFDLAVNASTYLIDDLVFVDQFATGDEVLFDLGFVGPEERWSALSVKYDIRRSYQIELSSCQRESEGDSHFAERPLNQGKRGRVQCGR